MGFGTPNLGSPLYSAMVNHLLFSYYEGAMHRAEFHEAYHNIRFHLQVNSLHSSPGLVLLAYQQPLIMCGDMNPRASRGGLIAAISPYEDVKTTVPELVLSFSNAENPHQTHATLSTSDHSSLHTLKNITTFTMRIE